MGIDRNWSHQLRGEKTQTTGWGRLFFFRFSYQVCSFTCRRKIYDQTGSLDDSEELTSEQFNNLYNYYKSQFAPVTEESIAAFEASYRGSEEEQNDVLQYYDEFEGNMDKAFEWILLSDPNKDSHRFRDIIEDAIEKNIVNRYKSFDAWARKVNKRPQLSEEAKLKKETGKKSNKRKKNSRSTDDTHSELVALMRSRQNCQNSLLDSFATKYGVSIGEIEEPSEEEFKAARKRILQRNKKD